MRKAFVLYTSDMKLLDKLTIDQRGRLITAIAAYAAGEDVPFLDAATDMLFSVIAAQIDRDTDRYEKTVERRKEAANKRWQMQKHANAGVAVADAVAVAEAEAEAVAEAVADAVAVEEAVAVAVADKEGTAKARPRFVPPALEEVIAYCAEKGYTFDPKAFFAYYASIGWKVGKSPMKDWKQACVTWQRREADKPQRAAPARNRQPEERHDYNFDDIDAMLIGKQRKWLGEGQ